LNGAITVLEENDGEDGSDYSNDQLNVGCLRKTECVQEVSLKQETELVAPADVVLGDIGIGDSLYPRVLCLMVVFEWRILIALIEALNPFAVFLLNLSRGLS